MTLYKRFNDILTPHYDEASAFYITLSLCLCVFFNLFALFNSSTLLIVILFLVLGLTFLIFGAVISIYHAFSNTRKSFEEKVYLIYYLIISTGIVGLFSGFYNLFNIISTYWVLAVILMIFSIMNISYAIKSLKYSLKIDPTKTSLYFNNRNAGLLEIIVGSIIVIGISVFCQFYLGLYWVITASICIVYVVGIHRLIRNMWFND